MGYKAVSDLSTDTVVKLGGIDGKTNKPNPTRMEGYFIGSREVKSENGTSIIHIFQTPKGNEGVWGTADLNSKLAQVTPGTMTLVKYKEKRKLSGGKTKHVYDVMHDDDNTIEVSAPKDNVVSSDPDEQYAADTSSNYSEVDESEDDSQNDELAEIEEQFAAKARQAKIQALLTKTKKG